MRSIPEITKGDASVIVSQKPEKHEAWGSFIPLRSATPCLRKFISVSPSYSNQSSPKRRRTFSYDIRTPIPSYWEEDSKPPSPEIPYITRTLPSSPIRPHSPTSSSASMLSHNVQSDLHPILARVEKKSKLCNQKVYCFTCRKVGSDFPRCGKCGAMWCSRPCRLVGGKRHVCSSRT